MKRRLDQELVRRKLVVTRSQAESYIKLGDVRVGREVVTKPGFFVAETDAIVVTAPARYVSRAGLKLASVAETLQLDFRGKVVLDVGSSTGGFTDFALQHGATKVVAVDVGTNQLHPSLRDNPKVELHEQTDIRDYSGKSQKLCGRTENVTFDVVVIDVSFISLREILPAIAKLVDGKTQVVAMVKPQFEAGQDSLKHKGVVKNEKMRRDILKSFEAWVQNVFIVKSKADSSVSGARGNRERFYDLRKTSNTKK